MTDNRSLSDWIVHSINIHGAFFEAWCRDVVSRAPGWSVTHYNYPVEWPRFKDGQRGQESSADLIAEWRQQLFRLSFVIECKKNNPDFTEWVFFPKRGIYTSTPSRVYQLKLQVDAAGRVSIGEKALGPFPWMSVVAEDGRETRADYLAYRKNDKTRTSNAAITDAARQVALAYRAIGDEVAEDAVRGVTPEEVPFHERDHVVVPIIVTTARLHVCEFSPADVDPRSGELPLDKAKLREVTHLRYEYALPPALQWQTSPSAKNERDWREGTIRQWIAVINSRYFEAFLKHYAAHLNEWVHMTPFPDDPAAFP